MNAMDVSVVGSAAATTAWDTLANATGAGVAVVGEVREPGGIEWGHGAGGIGWGHGAVEIEWGHGAVEIEWGHGIEWGYEAGAGVAVVGEVGEPGGKKEKVTKRRNVNHECLLHYSTRTACNHEQPCQRCIKRKTGHLCHDEQKPDESRTQQQRQSPSTQMLLVGGTSSSLASSTSGTQPSFHGYGGRSLSELSVMDGFLTTPPYSADTVWDFFADPAPWGPYPNTGWDPHFSETEMPDEALFADPAPSFFPFIVEPYSTWPDSHWDSCVNLPSSYRTRKLEEQFGKWLDAPSSSADYRDACDQRTKDTGMWLVNDGRFHQWENSNGGVLWLQGQAGSGKTFLCSNAIDCLRQKHQQVFYHYFDTHNANNAKTTYKGLLANLLTRMGSHPSSDQAVLERLFKNRTGHGKFSVDAMQRAVLELARTFSGKAYIVLDAMDECLEGEEVAQFIQTMLGVGQIHFLISCRHHMSQYIQPAVGAGISLDEERNMGDIEKHIERVLIQYGGPFRGIENEIKDELIAGAHGQIRWVDCQLEVLSKIGTRKGIRQALGELPRSLAETYQQDLERIDDIDKDGVKRILQLVVFSSEPVTTETASKILTFDMQEQKFPEDHEPGPGYSIYKMFPSTLVKVVDSGQELKKRLELVHPSVKEFLTSIDPDSPFFLGNQLPAPLKQALRILDGSLDHTATTAGNHNGFYQSSDDLKGDTEQHSRRRDDGTSSGDENTDSRDTDDTADGPPSGSAGTESPIRSSRDVGTVNGGYTEQDNRRIDHNIETCGTHYEGDHMNNHEGDHYTVNNGDWKTFVAGGGVLYAGQVTTRWIDGSYPQQRQLQLPTNNAIIIFPQYSFDQIPSLVVNYVFLPMVLIRMFSLVRQSVSTAFTS